MIDLEPKSHKIKTYIQNNLGWWVFYLLSTFFLFGILYQGIAFHTPMRQLLEPLMAWLLVIAIGFSIKYLGKRRVEKEKLEKALKDNDPTDENKKAFAKKISDEFRATQFYNDENGAIIFDLFEVPDKIVYDKPWYKFMSIDPIFFLTNSYDYTHLGYKENGAELGKEYFTTEEAEEKIADYIVDNLISNSIVIEPGMEYCCFRPVIEYSVGSSSYSSNSYNVSDSYGNSSSFTVSSGGGGGPRYCSSIFICKKSLFDRIRPKLAYDREHAKELAQKYHYGGYPYPSDGLEKIEARKLEKESRQSLF